METKHIKGLRVIGLRDGVTLGTIERIYVDPATKHLIGFGLMADPTGPTPASSLLVDAADVHTLGADALTLTDTEAARGTKTSEQLATLVEVDELTKRQVMTEQGVVLGEVVTVDLDPQRLQLARIELSPGFFRSNQWLPADQITRLGTDVVVVAEEVAASTDATMPPVADPPAELAIP